MPRLLDGSWSVDGHSTFHGNQSFWLDILSMSNSSVTVRKQTIPVTAKELGMCRAVSTRCFCMIYTIQHGPNRNHKCLTEMGQHGLFLGMKVGSVYTVRSFHQSSITSLQLRVVSKKSQPVCRVVVFIICGRRHGVYTIGCGKEGSVGENMHCRPRGLAAIRGIGTWLCSLLPKSTLQKHLHAACWK